MLLILPHVFLSHVIFMPPSSTEGLPPFCLFSLHNFLRPSYAPQVPDAEREAGIVAIVTKRGYMMHERVVRPADVGVTRAP